MVDEYRKRTSARKFIHLMDLLNREYGVALCSLTSAWEHKAQR